MNPRDPQPGQGPGSKKHIGSHLGLRGSVGGSRELLRVNGTKEKGPSERGSQEEKGHHHLLGHLSRQLMREKQSASKRQDLQLPSEHQSAPEGKFSRTDLLMP